MTVDIRGYQHADRQACLALLRRGHDPGFSDERFRWLHEEGPGGPSAITVAEDGGQIVGMYSIVRKPLLLGQTELCGGRDVDPVVDPAHRGRGLFSKLLQFSAEHLEGVDVCFNFANPASAPGFLNRGWQRKTVCEDRSRQLGFLRVASREFALWMLSAMHPVRLHHGEAKEITSAELRERLSNCRASLPLHAERLQVARNPEYLKWRYLDHPMAKYRYFVIGRDDWGLCIVRHRSPDRLMVVDLVDFGLRPRLENFVQSWMRAAPHAQVVVWSTIPEDLRRGWLGNPIRRTGLPLLVRECSRGTSSERTIDYSAWTLTAGDLEIS